MPTSIPVQIAEHQFRSLNKARIHYTGILHRHEFGGRLSESDHATASSLPSRCLYAFVGSIDHHRSLH